MNVRYCPHCAAKNEYTSAKPKFCGSCGKEFDRAFSTVNKSSPVMTQNEPEEFEEDQPQVRAGRTFKDARGRDVSHIYNRTPTAPVRQSSDEDYVDRDAMDALAKELAASISQDDFQISVQEKDNSIKLGSIINAAIAAEQAAPTKKKRSRKS